jgi:hypothetical protein
MLRDALARTLPDHMVPSAFVLLDALPLLANGKLDRRGLLRATGSESIPGCVGHRATDSRRASAGDDLRDVLDVDDVGAHDNFLDLGGHSLAAARIVSEVGKRFAVELTVQSPFSICHRGRNGDTHRGTSGSNTLPGDTGVRLRPRSPIPLHASMSAQMFFAQLNA